MPTRLPAAKATLIRELARHSTTRDREKAFILEGEKPIGELLEDPAKLLTLVLSESRLAQRDPLLEQVLAQRTASVYLCRDAAFATLSDVRTPSGLLAVVAQPIWNQEAILARPDILGQYGEQIQDPTNVGTTIRSAFAFGLDALWLSSDSADVFNPKVVRASAGAILKLPVFYLKDPSLLLRHRCTLYAAVSGGEQAPPLQSLTRLPDRTVVALGNESRGLSPETLAQAGACFRIPIAPDLESLNMAAAASITAFYFANLRRAGRRSSRSR